MKESKKEHQLYKTEIIDQKFCYCQINDSSFAVSGTKKIDQIPKMQAYYQTIFTDDLLPKSSYWTTQQKIMKGRKVQIVEYQKNSSTAKAWVDEGYRRFVGYIYLPKSCLHDTLPFGMKEEPKRFSRIEAH